MEAVAVAVVVSIIVVLTRQVAVPLEVVYPVGIQSHPPAVEIMIPLL